MFARTARKMSARPSAAVRSTGASPMWLISLFVGLLILTTPAAPAAAAVEESVSSTQTLEKFIEVTVPSAVQDGYSCVRGIVEGDLRPCIGPISVELSSGGWRARHSIRVAWYSDSSKVRYDRARAQRLEGSGSYKTAAHATLIKGHSYSGTQVFSPYTHSCASDSNVDATTTTCSSPWQATETGGRWFLTGGFTYDHGNDGSRDFPCDGCIDWQWVMP